jgi:hypothetical protein
MNLMKIRGVNSCRGCGSQELSNILSLGSLPIANELMKDVDSLVEVFPLDLSICAKCCLGQVGDTVSRGRLFSDYRYLSSISHSFLKHAEEYTKLVTELIQFKPGDWVLEIASNDGYLLKNFVSMGIDCLGIEPSENVSKIAKSIGVPTQNSFFGESVANELVRSKGYPKLVIANNVLAHVPDIPDFIKGIEIVTGPSTIISVENPSIMNIFKDMQFDSIYHEHYSYLSVTAVEKLLDNTDLKLFDAQKISTHGGSIRYWISRKSLDSKHPSRVLEIKAEEMRSGIFEPDNWSRLQSSVSEIAISFRDLLNGLSDKNARVWGFGAAAKASTILNYSKIEKGMIRGIADSSPEKQGWFMPTQGIPIVAPDEMYKDNPTHIIIFPWNIAEELKSSILGNLGSTTKILKLIPSIQEL